MSLKREVYWGNKWSYDFVRSPLFTGHDEYLPEEVLGDPRRLKYPWREDFQGERFAVKFPEQAKPFIENAAPRTWTHFNGTPMRLGLCSGLANTGYSVSSSSFPDYSLPPPEEKHLSKACNSYTTLPLETRREPATNDSLVFSYLRRRNYEQSQSVDRHLKANRRGAGRSTLLETSQSREEPQQAARPIVELPPSHRKPPVPTHVKYRPAAPDEELERARTTRLARAQTMRATTVRMGNYNRFNSPHETILTPPATIMRTQTQSMTSARSAEATNPTLREARGAGMMSHKPSTNGVAAALRSDNTRTSRIFF